MVMKIIKCSVYMGKIGKGNGAVYRTYCRYSVFCKWKVKKVKCSEFLCEAVGGWHYDVTSSEEARWWKCSEVFEKSQKQHLDIDGSKLLLWVCQTLIIVKWTVNCEIALEPFSIWRNARYVEESATQEEFQTSTFDTIHEDKILHRMVWSNRRLSAT